MSVFTVTATLLSRSTIEVAWTADSAPALGFEIKRTNPNVGGDPFELLAVVHGGAALLTFTDSSIDSFNVGQVLTYSVEDLDAPGSPVTSNAITINDPDVPFTNAPPDPAASAPRYTDLATVKRRLRIPAADTNFDEDLTEAIVAAEIALDFELGQSFPSTGTNPQYAVVPESVSMLMTSAAIAVYKAADAPFGTAGSDDMFGALSIADVASQTIRRSPLIRGLQLSFGVG